MAPRVKYVGETETAPGQTMLRYEDERGHGFSVPKAVLQSQAGRDAFAKMATTGSTDEMTPEERTAWTGPAGYAQYEGRALGANAYRIGGYTEVRPAKNLDLQVPEGEAVHVPGSRIASRQLEGTGYGVLLGPSMAELEGRDIGAAHRKDLEYARAEALARVNDSVPPRDRYNEPDQYVPPRPRTDDELATAPMLQRAPNQRDVMHEGMRDRHAAEVDQVRRSLGFVQDEQPTASQRRNGEAVVEAVSALRKRLGLE